MYFVKEDHLGFTTGTAICIFSRGLSKEHFREVSVELGKYILKSFPYIVF
jgi:hypothetical protein